MSLQDTRSSPDSSGSEVVTILFAATLIMLASVWFGLNREVDYYKQAVIEREEKINQLEKDLIAEQAKFNGFTQGRR